MAIGSGRRIAKAAALGVVSLALYAGLFFSERTILDLSSRGGWYFLVPVLIAFLFSLVHGAFTGHFWAALGIKAKK